MVWDLSFQVARRFFAASTEIVVGKENHQPADPPITVSELYIHPYLALAVAEKGLH